MLRRVSVGWSCLCVLASLAAPAGAHEGDPKAQGRLPRFEASRSGAGAALALAADDFAFPASGVHLMSWLPLRDFGDEMQSGNSCFGYAAPSGREYAVIGLSHGTGFVEVTDPGDPRVVAVVPGAQNLWRDIKVHAHHAYVSTEAGTGLQVIDMTQIDAGVVTLVDTITIGGLSTHTLALDATSGFLYRAGGELNGIRIYSLANPASPALVGAWSDRYVHEAQVVTYTSGPYAGRQIAFCCSGFNGGHFQTGLDILDVTNKSNIFLVKRFFYPNAGYSHQGWLSGDRKYFYLDDELDEVSGAMPGSTTRVIDVQDLSNPFVAATFSSGATSIDHNLYTHQGLIFEANYTSGLRVFDAANPTAPVEIGWFDTYPEHDLPLFHSLWNNYPFLPSGVVLGSDIEKGLFVWTLGAPTLAFDFPAGDPPASVDPAGATIPIRIDEASAGALVAGSATLHYDTGAGWTSAPLVAQGGGLFDLAFPAIPCGDDVAWYVTAKSGGTDATTWAWPTGAPTIVAHATAATTLSTLVADGMDVETGWLSAAPTDTATSGKWIRLDPEGTAAQPDDDHTPGPPGGRCWVTGNGPQLSNLGAEDVDGGATTVFSPEYDLAGSANPVVRYWRWFSTHLGPLPHGQDVLAIDVSNDAGLTWTNVETVGPGGPETTGGWILHQFRVADFVAPTEHVMLRFVASDFGTPSNVEAAFDDFAILDVGCPAPGPATYCVAKTNSQGCVPSIGSSGAPSASSPAAFDVTAASVINGKTGLLLYGFGRASTPFQGATLCVAAPLVRTDPQGSGGNVGPADCSGAFAYDFNARIQGGLDPALVPGTTVDAQYWYRDPADPLGFGTGLTDALEFTIAP